MGIVQGELKKSISRRLIDGVVLLLFIGLLLAVVFTPNEYILRAHKFLSEEFPIFYPLCMLALFSLSVRSAASDFNKGDLPGLYAYRTLLFGLGAAFFFVALVWGLANAF